MYYFLIIKIRFLNLMNLINLTIFNFNFAVILLFVNNVIYVFIFSYSYYFIFQHFKISFYL